MGKLLGSLKAEPVATMAIVTAAIGVATILGAPEKIMGAIAILIGALLAFPIRGSVTPTTTAATTVKVAAKAAANMALEQVNSHTAGPIGATTEESRTLATEVATEASDLALKAIGIKRKERVAS